MIIIANVQHSNLTGSDLHVPKSHAADHVNGDSIQSATAAQKGLATAAHITKLDAIETAADVTDVINVTAAGAVMDTDFNVHTVVVSQLDDTPVVLDLTATTVLGRNGSNDISALSMTTLRTMLNVADGATNYPGAGEQAFLDADHTKLDGIEDAATIDQTGAEIKSAYEAEADTNAFTDTEKTKLTGIEATADITDATNVAAAGAMMDSDISEAEGFLRKTGPGAYEGIKSNIGAAVSPTVNEDSGDGYAIGSTWLDTTADKGYICLDATVAAAVWKETTGAGSGLANIVEDTTPQLGGDLDLNGHEILLDTTPGTDHTASGTKGTFTNGNAGQVVFGDVCYMALDGHLEFADADASTTMPGLYMALETIAAAASGDWLIIGVARDDTWTWTIGPGVAGLIYVSLTGTTTNTLTQTAPSTTGDQVQIVGTAISADSMMFNPSPVLVEIA